MMTRRCAVLIFFILIGYSLDGFARNDNLFPMPAAIEHDVAFWKRIYTEVSTNQGLIHDDKNLDVVYQKISLPEKASRKARRNYVKKIKKKYRNILHKLSKGKRTGLTAEEQRVLNLWPKGTSNKEFRRAKERVRFQLGQSNKFRAGLIRSGAWKPYILKTLDEMGLPREIASLPHVESSFNHRAYSKVGAAGMWQFMRSTGRRFMRVDHVLDERMDPFTASVAAARLLENNYAVTGAWPLAITAYNHGAAGMRRAAVKLGTTDITTVLRKYKSRTFGFASRNFYVAFLAAVEIDSDPEKYFGKLNMEPPVDYEIVKIPGYIDASTLAKKLNIPRKELMETNPALRPAVWNGNKYIPKGYELKIDRRTVAHAATAHDIVAKLSGSVMYAKQKPDRYHRVRRGQTLSTISARYGVRVSDLMAVNNLRSRHRIYVGQVLRLPQGRGGKKSRSSKVQVAEKRSPKVEPRALPAGGTYKVRRGDTIDRIARRYGMSPRELQAMNNIRNKNRIYPGQRLILAKLDGDTYTV
ncbi:LysM peptidoglycan-binding domain-containing protein, partial [Kaarinaea lacus]